MNRQQQGFTLIEIMIAIMITGIIAVGAYSQLEAANKTQKAAVETDRRLAELQRAMNRISIDFQQVALRSVRDENGDSLPALMGEKDGDATFVSWTRQGKINPANLPRSELERITYKVEEKQLLREQWIVLDIVSEEQKYKLPILSDIESFEVSFYSEDQWHESWPINGIDAKDLHHLPRAVKFKLELTDFDVIEQVYILPSEEKSESK